MGMSTIFIIISLCGIFAAVLHFLWQPGVDRNLVETPTMESDTYAEQKKELLWDTVILIVFFSLLLGLGTQIN